MPTGRNIDLALGLKINDFLDANKKAYIEYSKTKGQIERNPIQLKGGTDFAQLSQRISSVGGAFQSLGSEIKPVFELFNQTNISGKNLSQAFVGLSDVGLRVFNMVSMLKIGVNGLMASIGPVGWVMLGITALTTAFSLFSSSTDNAKESVKGLSEELNKPGFLPAWMDPEKMARTFGMKYLVTQQKNALSEMEKAAEKNNLIAYEKAKEYYDKITGLIKKYTEMHKVVTGEKTDKEIAELKKTRDAEIKKMDDVVAYQFQTNRISLFDYIEYQKARLKIIEAQYGSESIEYMKQADTIKAAEEALLTYQSNNQERLTADFSANTAKRLGEVAKYVVKSVTTTTNETKKEVKALSPIMENMAGIIGYSIVDQLQRGSSAAKNMGDALVKMVESFAATLLTKTIIWTFFNLVTSGGAGSLLSFLGFAKGGEVKGKASGGIIDRSDIARSAFTPRGEDGLIGVQIGETIVNRRATQMFSPILDKLNEMGRRGYGYAAGGKVSEGGILKGSLIGNLEPLVEAIKNIRIEIRTELDAIQFYRNTFPKYEKIKNANRVI